ncbi:MAG: hypothetical protein ACOYOP_03465 [Microthrixaceae bacterium]
MPVRVLLALASSTCVTALVAGPMAYQASQADGRPTATTPVASTTTLPERSTTTSPPTTTPLVAGTTTERPSVALPAPSTSSPPRTTLRTPTTRPAGGTANPTPPPDPGPTVPGPSVLATTTTVPPATTRPPLTGDGIVWARSEARNGLVPLDGATVTGRVWVYYEDPVPARVSFWLDDPDGTGPPRTVEDQFPFTLVPGPTNGQPASLDTSVLADGPHSIRAEAVGAGGAVLVRVARFTVDN